MHLEVGPILQVRCAQVDMGGRSVCDPICDPVIIRELRNPLESRISELQLRFLAESNRRKRFCRPVPNHSAKEPYAVVCACKVTKNLLHTQLHPFLRPKSLPLHRPSSPKRSEPPPSSRLGGGSHFLRLEEGELRRASHTSHRHCGRPSSMGSPRAPHVAPRGNKHTAKGR